MELSHPIFVGFGLGFSLGLTPGPVVMKVASEAAAGQTWKAARVGIGATAGDVALLTLAVFGVASRPPEGFAFALLSLTGVALMDYFAYQAWRSVRANQQPREKALAGFRVGFLLAIASPLNWAWWAVTGVPFLAQYGIGLAAGFFPALITTTAAVALLFAFAGRRVRWFRSAVSYASSALLAAFACLLAFHAVSHLSP